MKIAMIGHKRIPSREGGVEIVVEELATRMAAIGEKVEVYNRKGKHVADQSIQEPHLKQYQGVRIITIPTSSKRSLNAVIYSGLATLRALFGHYDIIHFHAEGPAAMSWLTHLFHKRTIVTIHGLDWQRSKWGGFATKYLLFGEKMAAKYADEIIVLSKNVQEYFKCTYNRETCYIPNGVTVPCIKPDDQIRKEYGLKKNDYFLYLARIVPEKGVLYLAEAFMNLQTDKKLVIAGGSSHSQDYFQQVADLASKDPRIIMTGFVQGEKLEELYSNCLAYVLPSDLEGMPLSLLEAMSYQRKCIVSNIPEILEVIGQHGYQFEKGNIKELEDKRREVLEESKESGSEEDAGYYAKYEMDRFDWQQITQEHLKLYHK